jgi:ABC-2 type transport system ATP-binding protein
MDDLGAAETLAKRFRADLDRPIGQLSRGNRQKIGLLQAMLHDPELLIFDEPTSGLDPLMQEEFLAVVSGLRERGRTVLLSSPDLDEVERICDRVGLIRDGRLIAVERVADMLGHSCRHVTLAFETSVDTTEFAALPGVSDAVSQDGQITFKAAARHRVRDMQITHPTLEETRPHRLATPVVHHAHRGVHYGWPAGLDART